MHRGVVPLGSMRATCARAPRAIPYEKRLGPAKEQKRPERDACALAGAENYCCGGVNTADVCAAETALLCAICDQMNATNDTSAPTTVTKPLTSAVVTPVRPASVNRALSAPTMLAIATLFIYPVYLTQNTQEGICTLNQPVKLGASCRTANVAAEFLKGSGRGERIF